jgi:ribose/xylose/arabinose/galactoside ABC-type transport system permease subunit
MAALAGAIYIVQNILIYPDCGMNVQYGSGLEFEAIAISVMGGTSIFGGYASYPSVFIAAIAYSTFRSGLILFGLAGYWYIPLTGLLVLIFVLLHKKFI